LGEGTGIDAAIDGAFLLVLAMALANVLGLYVLASIVKRELAEYRDRLKKGTFQRS